MNFWCFIEKKRRFSKLLIGIEFIQQKLLFLNSLKYNIIIFKHVHVCTYDDVGILTNIQVIVLLLSLFIITENKVCVVVWGWGLGGGGWGSIVVYTVIIISLCPSHFWVGPSTFIHIKVAYNMRTSYDLDQNLFWPRWRSHHHQQQNGLIKVFWAAVSLIQL